MEQLNSKRIFFALWPDAQVRNQLQKLLSQFTAEVGQRHAPEDLHLTLVFIGQVGPEYYQCLRQTAVQVEFEPFAFELSRYGYFAKARVVSVEPDTAPLLAELAQKLKNNLRSCGYKPERREYRPHVTLLRKSPPPLEPAAFEPIVWTADRFCLVESHAPKNGRRYTVLEEFCAKF
ncbi:MAG TPA: RNA 2',3'-cyclic phosphodiesterase [Gammaproteobacteria bacterium]